MLMPPRGNSSAVPSSTIVVRKDVLCTWSPFSIHPVIRQKVGKRKGGLCRPRCFNRFPKPCEQREHCRPGWLVRQLKPPEVWRRAIQHGWRQRWRKCTARVVKLRRKKSHDYGQVVLLGNLHLKLSVCQPLCSISTYKAHVDVSTRCLGRHAPSTVALRRCCMGSGSTRSTVRRAGTPIKRITCIYLRRVERKERNNQSGAQTCLQASMHGQTWVSTTHR